MVLRAYPRSSVWLAAGMYVALWVQSTGVAR